MAVRVSLAVRPLLWGRQPIAIPVQKLFDIVVRVSITVGMEADASIAVVVGGDVLHVSGLWPDSLLGHRLADSWPSGVLSFVSRSWYSG